MSKKWKYPTNDEFERYWEENIEMFKKRDISYMGKELQPTVEAADQFTGLWKIAGLEYDVSWKHKNAKGKYVPRKYIARPTGQYGVVKEYTSSELIKYGRKKTMADVQSPEEWVAGKDASLTIEPFPEECPHPEWLGVWDRRGVGRVHVTWKSYEGMYIMKHIEKGYEFSREHKWTPDPDNWKQIEPAPLESRAHTKPKQKLSIGWDPYDLG